MVYSLFHPEKPAVFSLSSKTDLAENAKIDILWSRFCKKNTIDWDLFSLYSASFDVPNLSLAGARTEFLFNLIYHHLQTLDIPKNKGIFFEMKQEHVATIKAAVLMTSEGLYIIFFISSQSPTFSILNGWINILYFSRILI